MVSLHSANVAVRLNPLYGTSARNTQACVFWIAVRGSWLSVQVLSEGRQIARGTRSVPLLRMCPGPVRRASASSCSCDCSRTSGKPSLTDTNPFLALFPSIRQVSSMACSFPVDALYVDQYYPYRDPIGGMK